MTPLILAAALSIVALDSGPATSPAPAAPDQAASVTPDRAAAAQDAAANKKTCRAQVVTGSRFARRICMTKADWVEYDRLQKQQMDQFTRRMNDQVGLPSMAGPSVPAGN